VAIFVIRHGETPGNAARVVQLPDTALSPLGHRQADRLAARLSREDVRGILASDLARAAQTAEHLALATGARVTSEPLLQERNFGDLRGRAYADLDCDLFAPELDPPAGETWAVFHARVERAWARIREVAAETPGNLAVVTHGLVCFSLVANHFTLEAPDEVPLRFGNTSLTSVEGQAPWRVRILNCTAHLGGATESDPEGGAA